jgi:hypothetical protein
LSPAIWICLLVAAALGAFVAAPLLRPAAPRRAGTDEALSEARELESRKEMLLTSLKDLEDDHQTDKIDDADYAALHARLSGEAIEVLRQLDAARERDAAEAAAGAVRHPSSRRPSRPG